MPMSTCTCTCAWAIAGATTISAIKTIITTCMGSLPTPHSRPAEFLVLPRRQPGRPLLRERLPPRRSHVHRRRPVHAHHELERPPVPSLGLAEGGEEANHAHDLVVDERR